MPRARTRFLGCVLTACLMAPATGFAQGPWNVTVTPTLNPLPVGFCGALQLTVVDVSGREVPRNPQGVRVTIADFDISVSGSSVAASRIDASHWVVCACQGAAVGSTATVIASYPARSLAANARVPGVVLQRPATFTVAPPKGTSNPPACTAAPAVPAATVVTEIPIAPAVLTTPAGAADAGRGATTGRVVEPTPARGSLYVASPVSVTLGLSAHGSWYEAAPVALNLSLSANGTWYEAAPVTMSLSLSASGAWYEAAPVAVTFDLRANGTWVESREQRPLQPSVPGR